MNILARLCLMLLAGLALAGCVTKSAETKVHPAMFATVREERPESSGYHWFRRDLEDKIERTFER